MDQEASWKNQSVKTPLQEGLLEGEILEGSNAIELDNVYGVKSLQTHYQIMIQALAKCPNVNLKFEKRA